MEKIIKLTPTDLIAVVVPEDANGFYFVNTNTKFIAFFSEEVDHIRLGFSTLSKLEILGTVDKDNISFDVDPYVRKVTLGYWLDYTKPNARHDFMASTPNDSFRSLLYSHGITFENPYGKEPPHNIGLLNMYPTGQRIMDASFQPAIKWQTAQDSLVKKIVILKPI